MASSVLHILSQRPQLTGSGVTLDALALRAARHGWRQAAVIGVPRESIPGVAGIDGADLYPLLVETDALPFALPGMSDTMPYRSSRFSTLTAGELDRYREALRERIAFAVARHRPDVIHSHHVWLATAAARDVAGDVPIVVHVHGTGLRQLRLCPHLADEVVDGVRRCDRFLALHGAQAAEVAERLEVDPERVTVVGAGYRDDLFTNRGRDPAGLRIGYAGKMARAKGVPWLIEAFESIAAARPGASLHLAGGGDNADAESIRDRVGASRVAGSIELCGRLDQRGLAELLRTIDVFALPSLYEGLPLVLVEAYASGCRLVATDLPGTRELAPILGDRMTVVPAPRRIGPDEPVAEDLPAFTDALTSALRSALDGGTAAPPAAKRLRELSWDAVFAHVERSWADLVERNEPRGGR